MFRIFMEKGLRVLMISYIDAQNFFGQSTRPYYIGKVLSDKGVKILHICPKPPEAVKNTLFVALRKEKNLLKTLFMLIKALAISWFFNPAVIYIHQPDWFRNFGLYLVHFLKKPVVLDYHGSPLQELEAIGYVEFDTLRTMEHIEWKALSSVDKVIVVSHELKEFLHSRFDFPRDQLVIIPNGVDLRLYKQPIKKGRLKDLKKKLHIPGDKKIIIFTCPREGLFSSNEIALKWFFKVVQILNSKRNDLIFLILGSGKIIPPPSSSILYTGFVRDLQSTLKISDVCVLPYPNNAICGGVRNKALEYFAAGKPIVSTSEGMRGIKGAVQNRDYILADTIEEFAERIIEVLSNHSLAQRISFNALKLAERYDWNPLGKKVYDLLSSIVDHPVK